MKDSPITDVGNVRPSGHMQPANQFNMTYLLKKTLIKKNRQKI